MKACLFSFVVGWVSVSASLAQVPLVGIRATRPETVEPSPNTRVIPGEFLITREGGTLNELVVYVDYGGSATPGADYAELPQRVTIPAGALSRTLLVEPRDDTEVEGDEVVVATLQLLPGVPLPGSNQGGYVISSGGNQARVVIHDNDPPVVSLSAPSFRTGEPCTVCLAVPAVFRFERSGPTGQSLTVFLHTDGTATAELDYIPLPRSVEIAAGQAAAELRLLARDDQLVEGPEVVRVRLLEPPDAAVPYQIAPHQNTALAMIGDDEPDAPEARLDFVFPREGDHFAPGLPLELSVIGVWTQGEIDHGVDFYDGEARIGSTPPSMWLRPPIPGLPSVHTIWWEQPSEGNHTLTARSELSLDWELVSAPVTITVGEQPLPTVVSIQATQRIAEETSAPLRRLRLNGLFTVSRKGPTQHALPVYVTYTGSSTPGQDVPFLPWMVTIPAGASSVEIPVEAVEDEVPEPIETLVATISNCPPEPLRPPCYDFQIDPAGSQATVFLRDDGITRASLDLVRPEEGAQFELGQAIDLEAIAIDLEGYLSRIEFWADETLIGVSEIVFIRAPDPGSPIHHTFQWNGAPPGPHLLTARVTVDEALRISSAPVAIRVRSPALLPVVGVTAPDPFALEPVPGSEPNPARFRISRFGSMSAALAVRYALEGTAENGVDYERLTGEVVIPAGTDSVLIPIWALADEAREGLETVALRLIESDAYRIAPRHGRAGIVISEDRPPHPWPRCIAIRDGFRYLWFLAEPGRRFRMEASADLRSWETVFQGDAAGGTIQYVDADTAGRRCRFYRLVPE